MHSNISYSPWTEYAFTSGYALTSTFIYYSLLCNIAVYYNLVQIHENKS